MKDDIIRKGPIYGWITTENHESFLFWEKPILSKEGTYIYGGKTSYTYLKIERGTIADTWDEYERMSKPIPCIVWFSEDITETTCFTFTTDGEDTFMVYRYPWRPEDEMYRKIVTTKLIKSKLKAGEYSKLNIELMKEPEY